MGTQSSKELRERLLSKKAELSGRLERINANLRRPLNSDSKERAMELESSEVVDALGNEARGELAKISDALARMMSGEFGKCVTCSKAIDNQRLSVYPYATECIECAKTNEQQRIRR